MSDLWQDYIGDGVYVSYDQAGGIWLKANDHRCPTDKIYLEPAVFHALVEFQQQCESVRLRRKGDGNHENKNLGNNQRD
jgi:hypothetical protein